MNMSDQSNSLLTRQLSASDRVMPNMDRTKLINAKKCWICLTIMDLSKDELMLVQQMFFSNNFNQNESKFVQLKVLFDKIVLSICKCRKKLAHEECFNNYIDSIQSGNVNILISCAHCNLKYEFNYPYNGIFLKIFDLLDQFLNVSSTSFAYLGLALSTYWSSLSFGALTLLQINGVQKGLNILKSSNVFVSAILLPVIPIALVCGRFLHWESVLQYLIPSCFKFQTKLIDQKLNDYQDNEDDDDDGEKEDMRFLSRIRLVVGGLLLPSTIVSIDRFTFGLIYKQKSTLFRTLLIGIGFVGLKGFSKVLYNHKKIWQKENREIKNYEIA